MASQSLQLAPESDWLLSNGWRTVGHSTTQSDKKVVRKIRQVYLTKIVQPGTHLTEDTGKTSEAPKKVENSSNFANEESRQSEIPWKIREKLKIQEKLNTNPVRRGEDAEQPGKWLSQTEIENSKYSNLSMSRYTVNGDTPETKSTQRFGDDKAPSAAPRDYSHRGNLYSSTVGKPLGKEDYIVRLRGESPPPSRPKRAQKREDSQTTDFEPIEDDFSSVPQKGGVKPEVKSEWYKQMFKSMNPDSMRAGASEKEFPNVEDDSPTYKDRSSRRTTNSSGEQLRSKSTPYQNNSQTSTPMNRRNTSSKPKADHFREFLDFDDAPQNQTDSRERRVPSNHIETGFNDDSMLNGFEVKRTPNQDDSRSAYKHSPNEDAPRGGNHRSRASLDQKTLLKLAASVNELKESGEKEKSSGNAASNNRARRERPKRIDEFHQIKQYFDTLSKNAEDSNLPRNSRRTQSLDRAKVSNRSQALGNKNFENIQKKFNSPGNISERRNEDQSDGKRFSKWKLSTVDENYLNQRQYKYTIREPKAVRPPRPELPPSSAIDTDFITHKRGLDENNEDMNDYGRSLSPRDVNGDGLNCADDGRQEPAVFYRPNQIKSAYALSLHPQPEEQFGANHKVKHAPNKIYSEKMENFDDAGEDSDSDTASLPSQVENYRPGSGQNVVRDPVVRANLEEKIQKCNGKINGNHDIYGSRNSLKQQAELTDQIDIGWNQPVPKTLLPNVNTVNRTPSDRRPLVKSGIDIWQNRIEAVETAKNRSSTDLEVLNDPVIQQNSPGGLDSEDIGNNDLGGNYGEPNIDNKDGFIVTPTDSNKSSFKESEAENNDYNFYLSNKSFLNSIPQPYNKLKVGAPYESSSTFRKRPDDLRDNRDSPKVTTFGADPQMDNLSEVTKNVERMFDAPAKINDEFSEQGEKTTQREYVEQLVYFPKSKEFFTIENDRDRQQLRLKNDPHYFITVTRKQTEEVLTKIDAGWENNCPKIPINEDVRSFAREISNRRAGSTERNPNKSLASLDTKTESLDIDRYTDNVSSRTNLSSQGQLKETVLNSPTKKLDYSGSNAFRPGPIVESYNSNSNLRISDPRDSLLSPVENDFAPPHHSTANRSNTEPRDSGFQSSNRDLSRTDSSNRYRKNNHSAANARVALSSRGPNSNRSASVDALNVVSSDGRDTNSLSDFKASRESGTRMPLSQHRSQNRSSYSSYINGEDPDETVPMIKGDNVQSNEFTGQKVFKDDSPEDYGMNARRQPVNASGNLSMSASALNEFNSKEGDSGVELDYNSGPNSDELRLFQSESNLYDNGARHLPTSDTNEQISPTPGDGNNEIQTNDTPVKESSSRPIKKVLSKIFKKKPKSREDANGGSSSNAQSGAEDGALSPSMPASPPQASAVTSSEAPTTTVKTNKSSATVMYNFRPEFHGEIAVQKGDIVSVIRNVDENWVEVETNNGIGIVPKDYIKKNKNNDQTSKTSAAVKEKQQDKKLSSTSSKKQPHKENELHKSSEKLKKSTGSFASEKQPDGPKNSDRAGSMRSLNSPSMKPLTIQVNNYNNNDKLNQRNTGASADRDRFHKSSKTSHPQEAKRVIAKHNFPAENDDDLALRVNDIVNVTKRVDQNWYEGTIGKRKGIFPVNCVEVIDTRENLEPSPEEYSPQVDVETSFISGTPNKNTKQTSDENDKIPQWQNNNSANSLNRMKADQGSLQDLPPGEPFKVIFRYQHQKPDELDLEEGDILYAIEKCDDGWFIGTSERTGKYGTFPGNYVTKINL